MGLTRAEVHDRVVQCIREVLGDREVGEIDDTTNPIKDLGLDSEDGVALACALSEAFAFHMPDHINPLVDDKRRRGRRVAEIVDLVVHMLSAD